MIYLSAELIFYIVTVNNWQDLIAYFLLANNVDCYLDTVFAIVSNWNIVDQKKKEIKKILYFAFFSYL